ncbi:MAG: putative quinol monooxygenase [Planctomycetota bacterium]|jgi:quinol monooxygenase YgiN
MSQVTVVATIRARSETLEQVREILLGLLEPTRAEEGCINYDMYQDLDEPRCFVFHENWTSRAHLERHLAMPHLQAGLEQLQEVVDGLEIRVLSRVA